MKKLTLFQLFDELQGHESNVAQTLREIFGRHLALVSLTSNIPPVVVMIESHLHESYVSTPKETFKMLIL